MGKLEVYQNFNNGWGWDKVCRYFFPSIVHISSILCNERLKYYMWIFLHKFRCTRNVVLLSLNPNTSDLSFHRAELSEHFIPTICLLYPFRHTEIPKGPPTVPKEEAPVLSWSWSQPIRYSPKLSNPWRRTSSNPDPSWAQGLSKTQSPGMQGQPGHAGQASCSEGWDPMILLRWPRTPNHLPPESPSRLCPAWFTLLQNICTSPLPKELRPWKISQEGSLPV